MSSDRIVSGSSEIRTRGQETLGRREFLRRAALTYAALLPAGALAAYACDGPAIAGPVVAEVNRQGVRRNFMYGAAINASEVRSRSDILVLVESMCKMVTLGGPLYWGILRPDVVGAGTGDGRGHPFDFTSADLCSSYATAQHLLMRGHNLLWHNLNPQWLTRELNSANAEFILREHIATTVGRYRGKLQWWDVLNEIAYPPDGRSDGLRNSIWMRASGPRHLRMAFEAAHDADPAALLGYNEHSIEGDDPSSDIKRRVVLNFLSVLVRERIPIHYLGIQAHLRPTQEFSAGKLGTFIRSVRDLGLQVHVTELDVNDQLVEGDIARRDAVVADTYDRFLSVVLSEVEVPTVSTWGISDLDSWLQRWPRPDSSRVRPLPFDDQLRPKQAWWVVRHYLADPPELACTTSSAKLPPSCWPLRSRPGTGMVSNGARKGR